MTRPFLLLSLAFAFAGKLAAAQLAVPVATVPLGDHLPGWATPGRDLGAAPADLSLDYLRLTLKRTPQREAAFQQLLLDQHDPASPRYQAWLTPRQIGEHFGPTAEDILSVTQWLQEQGLAVDNVANSRMFVIFHGSVQQVQRAFQTRLHIYSSAQGPRLSVNAPPRIPAAIAPMIQSVQGLTQHTLAPGVHARPQYSPCYGGDCYHFIAPADFAKIYDIGTTYTGSGQTVAIIGRAQVFAPDITEYETNTGLPSETPTLVVPPNGIAPPPPNDSTTQMPNDDQTEATLDVQRVFGTAPGAAVDLVASLSTSTQDGTDIAKDYVIDNAPTLHVSIMTNSFGECEAEVAPSFVQADNTLFQQAAAEGISSLGISGDSGASGCDPYNDTPPATPLAISPNYLCSSGYVTCLGGTEFNDTANPSAYWSTTSSSSLESALGYIPEGAWNEPGSSPDFSTSATGGGVSKIIPLPYWQTGAGVPGSAGRYTPDLSFSSASHDGYYGCYAAGDGDCAQQYFEYFYGTSAAAPSMAGVVALLNQKLGKAQGNLNPTLYSLAQSPSNAVFHDATIATSGVTNCSVTTPSMCNNSTPAPASLIGGQSGYLLTTGFDLATGWGSVNVTNLLSHWATGGPAATTTNLTISPAATVSVGTTVTLIAKVTGGVADGGLVDFYYESIFLTTVPLEAGSASFIIRTTGFPEGSFPLQARFRGNASFVPSNSAFSTVTLDAASSTTTLNLSPNPASPGQAVTFSAAVTSADGIPTGMVTFNYQPGGTLTLGTALLVDGKATLKVSTTGLPAGQYPLQVLYGGATSIGPSRSAIVAETIK